ncbi:hypothetical protein MVEN_02226300 [Mycena venus]|uniref:Uncharacterized protein n=1 Tax=Mycena venus TaxID=2733690 RepID=A0A8H6X778_9AGAR|nr:hypothetical protein MVEN_02226300 [Mycena venus]
MNSTNNTADSVGGHGGIGSKIKGAAQTINGLGENVRGTILGGVDTVLHKDSSANDAIAAKGRAQHAEGMANLEGRSTRPAAPAQGNWQSIPTNQAGGDPYLNKVNQEASRGHHTAGTINSGQYNPYHDSTAVAQNIPRLRRTWKYSAASGARRSSH